MPILKYASTAEAVDEEAERIKAYVRKEGQEVLIAWGTRESMADYERCLSESATREPIVFRSEPVLWGMLMRGEKQFDMRRWDLNDERIARLARGHWEESPPAGRMPAWEWDEAFVAFQNKETGEVLPFRYAGMEFVPWAPGWVFLLLGGLGTVILPLSAFK